MNATLIAARAVHFFSAIVLFGEFVFVLVVAAPTWGSASLAIRGESEDIVHRLLRLGGWSLAASIASGAVWLAIVATTMSGLSLDQAISREILSVVLGRTGFGRLWVLRFGLGIALGALLMASARAADDKSRFRLTLVTGAFAAAYLATLAWAGHAAAGQGLQRYFQLTFDVVHLIAAGAWLGALPGFVLLLRSAQSLDGAALAARRFSSLGVVCVSALVLSGLVNTWYLVGDLDALTGTDYGRLLLAKLALFAAMVILAAVNRSTLTPRLAGQDRQALRLLRTNATIETAAGIAVVAFVGALGVTVPGAHLDHERLRTSPAMEEHMHR